MGKNTIYKGKATCETLKKIRKDLAKANGIKYEPHECTHEGDCAGTCPACEQETRYIERQLNMRKFSGKAAVVVGVSAGLISLSSCNLIRGGKDLGGAVENPNPNIERLEGEVAVMDSTDVCTHNPDTVIGKEQLLEGDVMIMPDSTDIHNP
ncbi:MAG: hypothetical protein K6A98_06510 [Prevotella sp.]|nr:hypothetical protein [Prevotella sp.]MCR5152787.1 hypothetical protein [Prevotella sp.]